MLSTNTSTIYSDLKDSVSMSSLHSSESLSSVAIPLQTPTLTELNPFESRSPMSGEPLSSITDLDETIKSPSSTNSRQKLHMATEIVERFDEGLIDDGAISQTEEDENNSVALSDSEDEIEHFDSNDSIIAVDDHIRQQQSNEYFLQTNLDNSNNNTSNEGQTISLGKIFLSMNNDSHEDFLI